MFYSILIILLRQCFNNILIYQDHSDVGLSPPALHPGEGGLGAAHLLAAHVIQDVEELLQF